VDFFSAVQESAASLDPSLSKNLAGFVTRLCIPINRSIRESRENGIIASYPDDQRNHPELPGQTITTIFVEGYFRGYPQQAVARLSTETKDCASPPYRPI